MPGLGGATVTAASRSLRGDLLAAGTADGRVALAQVRFQPVFKDQTLQDLELELRDRGGFEIDPQRRPVRELSYQESPEGEKVGRRAGRGRRDRARPRRRARGRRHVAGTGAPDPAHEAGRRDHARAPRARRERSSPPRASGVLYHWDTRQWRRAADRHHARSARVPADRRRVGASAAPPSSSATRRATSRRGSARGRGRRRDLRDGEGARVRAPGLGGRSRSPPRPASAASPPTGARRVARPAPPDLGAHAAAVPRPAASAAVAALITPRADGIVVSAPDGTVERYSLDNPHPEFSWHALLGKVWYEGYPQPEYVWQSTGGTDDFEPKLSLVPLIFGTIKATFYALVFAVPLAVMGALYTSQFVHPSIKAKVKPTVEIMAALPSVVIGFVAGLWLASRVEATIVPVLLLIVLLPLVRHGGRALLGSPPVRRCAGGSSRAWSSS